MTLEFALNRDAPAAASTDCVVVGVFADKTLTPAAQALDTASGGRLRALIERGDIDGKTGRSVFLHDLSGIKAPRVLVVAWANRASSRCRSTSRRRRRRARAANRPVKSALLTLPEITVPGQTRLNVRQA